jgi:hypothetical protein
VSFESPILKAIAANVTTSLNICNLAEDCPNLQRLTTTSTAYVQPHRSGPIYEELVSLPYPATELLEDLRLHPEDEANILRFKGHQNTYTLTWLRSGKKYFDHPHVTTSYVQIFARQSLER